jgi:hypothetical protein
MSRRSSLLMAALPNDNVSWSCMLLSDHEAVAEWVIFQRRVWRPREVASTAVLSLAPSYSTKMLPIVGDNFQASCSNTLPAYLEDNLLARSL